ncbi:MAG: hypothetical protein MUC59_18355 [Saprospiraceae bacterium]|jgi:hypothetical protein|nr:hypothetical protein [Saprospiraceae bacterium]
MQHHRINSIAELQAEQLRLKAIMRQTRHEFARSANETSNSARDFLLKKVLLPIGAISLGAAVVQGLNNRHDQDPSYLGADEQGGDWLPRLLAALPFLQQFFEQGDGETQAPVGSSDFGKKIGAAMASGPAGLLNLLLPLAIPFFQKIFQRKHDENLGMVEGEGGSQQSKASAFFEGLMKWMPVLLPIAIKVFASQKKSQD